MLYVLQHSQKPYMPQKLSIRSTKEAILKRSCQQIQSLIMVVAIYQ